MKAADITATVPIVLPADPTTNLQAATKQMVDLKAPLASPTFTGDPKSVTPATADNDTSIATTAHVQANAALKVSKTGDTMTGTLIAPEVRAITGNLITRAEAGFNAHLWLQDDTGATRGSVYWDRAADSVRMHKMITGQPDIAITLMPDGRVQAGKGLNGRTGLSGTNFSNSYNFWWNPPNLECWIDNTWLGAVTFASDYRIKKDVLDLPSMWETVKALRPISYTQAEYTPLAEETRSAEIGKPFIAADDIERWGFVAHELQETLVPSAAIGHEGRP